VLRKEDKRRMETSHIIFLRSMIIMTQIDTNKHQKPKIPVWEERRKGGRK
jgi:hypothetical protein